MRFGIPTPHVTPLMRSRAPSSTPLRIRSAAAISHSTFIWTPPAPPSASRRRAPARCRGNGVADQLLVVLAPRAAVIGLRNGSAVRAKAVGVDARERADAAAGGPGARAFAVRHRNALAAFDQRQHLASRYDQRVERPHFCELPREPVSAGPPDRWPTAEIITSGQSVNTAATPHWKRAFARASACSPCRRAADASPRPPPRAPR